MENLTTATARAPFTMWHREIDGPGLVLSCERSDRSLAEWIELDVRDLPNRPELLARIGPRAKQRLLNEAAMPWDERAGSWSRIN